MGFPDLAKMKRAIRSEHVTTLERAVLLDMATASADGISYRFGWGRLAEALGKEPGSKAAKRSLERLIGSLIAKGFITQTHRASRHTPAEYRLNLLAPAPVDNSAMGPGSGTQWAPVLGVYGPRSDRGPRDIRETGEERASAPPALHCLRHPSGDSPTPCRGCADARRARAAQPTVEGFTVRPGAWCAPGSHSLSADGACNLCDKRPHDIAAEARPVWPAPSREDVIADADR